MASSSSFIVLFTGPASQPFGETPCPYPLAVRYRHTTYHISVFLPTGFASVSRIYWRLFGISIFPSYFTYCWPSDLCSSLLLIVPQAVWTPKLSHSHNFSLDNVYFSPSCLVAVVCFIGISVSSFQMSATVIVMWLTKCALANQWSVVATSVWCLLMAVFSVLASSADN